MNVLADLKGRASALVFYPAAERLLNRDVRSKIRELRSHYALPFARRKRQAVEKLADMLEFAGEHVPYYRDLFSGLKFVPDKIRRDPLYLEELPFLTKDIVREHGPRLLSRSLEGIDHYPCKSGGSTGPSCIVQYDREAADYSSAVTRYARECIGKRHHMSELHFSSRFPERFPLRDRVREYFKCLAMNRYNIFFDRLDDRALDEIWSALKSVRPHLVHAHPSTTHALSRHVERKYGSERAFEVFESSGELLTLQARKHIASVLNCRVTDRYGLAEFGVIAYELDPRKAELQVLDSEGWPESVPIPDGANGSHELVFTGFRNRLMPLIRYRTGDLAYVEERPHGYFLRELVGRIHDMIHVDGTIRPTHYIQDVLDRVGGIQDFQIDVRTSPPTLGLIPEADIDPDAVRERLDGFWHGCFQVNFIERNDIERTGRMGKFRYVVGA